MERPLLVHQYVQYDLIRLSKKYHKLGYELTLDQCYDIWAMYSESEYSNWLDTTVQNIKLSVKFIEKVLNSTTN